MTVSELKKKKKKNIYTWWYMPDVSLSYMRPCLKGKKRQKSM